MVDVYNLYVGGYLPKVSPESNVHNRRELKNKYKSILSMNNAKPLSIIKLTGDTQAYALDVKEMSMELGEAAQNAYESQSDPSQQSTEESLKKMTDIFNGLLQRSDEFGEANDKPSRPGGELRSLVERNREELMASGFSIDEKDFLSIDASKELSVPENFLRELADKSEKMSMNPMEYVDKKVYSYAHIHQSDVGTAYESSMYSGMLFNSYC